MKKQRSMHAYRAVGILCADEEEEEEEEELHGATTTDISIYHGSASCSSSGYLAG
jgi:hypothetical protein